MALEELLLQALLQALKAVQQLPAEQVGAPFCWGLLMQTAVMGPAQRSGHQPFWAWP